MNKYEFGELIKDELRKIVSEDYEIKLQEVKKNNNVMKLGIMVSDKAKNVAPTIYLDDLYKDHQMGRPLDEIVQVVSSNLKHGMPKKKIEMEFFTNYEEVKDKICYRLINQEMNEERLERIPYVPFLDLAICFFYPFWHEEIGSGSILVSNEHAKTWGVTVKDLWKAANENTKALYPATCCPMDGLLMEMTGRECGNWPALPENHGWGQFSMKVLTNRQRVFGSAVILYDGYLEQLSERLEGSFYVIPSSIHEMLIVPALEGEEARLERIISETNKENLEEEDILSYHLYRYDKKQKKMEIIA